MANAHTPSAAVRERADVKVVTSVIGRDRYRIVATATLDGAPAEVWSLMWDWKSFLAVTLPGLTSAFEWLSGGPDQVPSTFQFAVAGGILEEEVYERTADGEAGRYRLRYRVLEPALGMLEYDAVLELQGMAEARTAFSATREVRLAPDAAPDMLAAMIESETQCLVKHFAA
jgi:hypothetical protein